VQGSPWAPEQRARLRAAAAWATGRAAAAIDVAYRAGGSHALFADHPLQRRLRDIHTIGQHFLVRPDTLTTAGAVLTGQEVDLTVF
jgi:indole-3-acetate monooxygenase